ncbi:RNA polymerase sigma factor [Galbibacter sp. BG1]|uniref:RNA polymerase sigma factor n=1 Tax=Galbibacter sp. BG1 TaxID=1170699 RepID=UPI0015B95E16|nr:RNA polymerase sigma factor [Galbibacter sp. BG1]QLE02589.1 RNA polymerase sigma factor [Galbibacter sp. BG1]
MSQEEEFTATIKQHEGIIYKITRLYTQNLEDQQDLFQEIVYQLWKGFHSFRGEAKISTWMYRVALNTALMHLKKVNRRGTHVSLDGILLKQEQYDPIIEERLKILYEKIKQLNDLDRALIFLYLEDKKYEEIALITGISSSNVGTRISRIKEKLRKKIKK